MIGVFWMTNWIRHPKIIQSGKKCRDSMGSGEKLKKSPKMFQTLASARKTLGIMPMEEIG
jgi:hypothetical protein